MTYDHYGHHIQCEGLHYIEKGRPSGMYCKKQLPTWQPIHNWEGGPDWQGNYMINRENKIHFGCLH